MTFYRDKLLEAVFALVDHGDLRMRLTYAAGCLLQIDDDDVPAGRLAEFERVRDPLIDTPMVSKGEMLPRELDVAEAKAAVQAIVDLLAVDIGGDGTSKRPQKAAP